MRSAAYLCKLIHSAETIELGGSVVAQATFALPTDDTDLNHIGMPVRIANGLTFCGTDNTAYAERL